MTPDRWRLVEDLCHAALAHAVEERALFLEQACAGDDGLQREVESLIAQDRNAAGFMSLPAVAVAGSPFDSPLASSQSTGERLAQGRPMLDEANGILVGQRLGVYAIRSLLGVGGMGEVYRAHDDTLGREVAIKVLPPAFTADPDRRARFEREARMLATLNHPHIGAIYGVHEADASPDAGQAAVRALVLELVEGETLAERIAGARADAQNRSGLPIGEALTIARQIADALDAAHEKGIVHRDLKPANIKITPDGVVKVLDFGLAKAVGGDGSTSYITDALLVTPGRVSDGVVMGTAAYMSPEQARGLAVDKRTDIWAFGCVLYEMLTGRAAFAGDTVSDTIAKVIEREPDWSALPPATPAPIRRLLLRCLAKVPKQRVRDIGDVRIEIDAIDEVLPGPVGVTTALPVSARTPRTWLPWVAAAALAIGVGAWEARRPFVPLENPLANARFSRFTDWEGTEEAAVISPDGRFVAFLADRDGEFDVWLSQVGTERFVNLTREFPPLEANALSLFRKLGFSGDGAEIWFTPGSGPSMAQMLLPLIGGSPRPFLDKGVTAPSWSPDGTRLTYFKNESGDPLFVADRTGTNARQILVHEERTHTHNPIWSPDGQWIYFVHGLEPTDQMDVWRVRPSGESAERLTDQKTAATMVAPLDARTLLYLARAEDGSGPWLWALDTESKVTRRVDSGVGQYMSVSASRDGRRAVATVANTRSNLWRVPLLGRQAEDRDAEPYPPLATVRALGPRFGATSLFYLSARGAGDDGLWRVEDGQASEIWRSPDGPLSGPPAVSPDGTRVVVVVRQEGKRHLVIVSADGRSSRRLATSIDIQGQVGQGTADWSPDGRWIVTGGIDAQGPGLFKIPVDSGAPVRLVAGPAGNPVWSPNGDLIVYGGPFATGQVKLFGVHPDGTPVELPAVRVRPGGYRFLPNGSGLVFLPFLQSLDFWLLDLTSKSTRQLTRFANHGQLTTFDMTPDGKDIVFDRARGNSDIVQIDLAK
jgi:serine/threonine protein kinase